MGKKEQELQIEIMYSREDIDKVYAIEKMTDQDGITFMDVVYFRDQSMNDNKIFTEVKMSYMSEDEEILPINEEFFLSYSDISKVFEGNFVVMLTPEIDEFSSKINEIEEKMLDLERQIQQVRRIKEAQATEAKEMYLRKHVSLPETMRKQMSQMPREKSLQIGILFSQPLVQKRDDTQDIKVLAQPVKYREQIERLKRSLQKTGRTSIFIKCLIATVQTLEKLVRQKVKILHLICHGSIQTEKKTGIQEGVLQFQQLYNIGCMDKIYGRQIPQFLANIPVDSKPKLVFVNACHSELIGDAFIESGVPFVVVIQSSEKIEDTAAQLFAEKFYNSLFNGLGVKDSFQDAIDSLNRQNPAINSNICCCIHTLAHQPKCLFKQMQEELGKDVVHELCHIPTCKCPKRHLHIHQITCIWAIDTLYSINRQFRVMTENGPRKPTFQQLEQRQQLFICCCSTRSLKIPHDETEKFKFKHSKDADPNQTLYEPSPFSQLQAEVFDETAPELKGNFVRGEKLFGRSLNIFSLIYQIKQDIKVVLVYGAQGSGKSKVVTRAVSYMIQRGYFKHQYLYFDMGNVTNSIDFNFKIIKKVKYLKLNNLLDIYSALAEKQMVIVMDNIDGFINSSYLEFKIEIERMITKLSNAKIILVLNEKTVKHLDASIFNQKRYYLEPLKKFAAADMFLLHAKEYLKDINMKQIWRLFENQNMRIPKTILDMVHFIKSHFSIVTKVSVSDMVKEMETRKSKQVENQKFLQENLNQLKEDAEAFKIFLFLCEFRDGLTELDFNIMSNHSEEDVIDESALIPQNWRDVLCRLVYHDQVQKGADIEEGHYYFCDIEMIGDLKKVKVKKYILQYMKEQNKFTNPEMKFNALAYLSIFSMSMLKIVRQQYYYHQKLLQYCNLSNAGIFQLEREVKFAQFFDQGEYFPDSLENMSKSTRKNNDIDKGIKKLFLRKKSLFKIHPSTSLVLHYTNIMELYRNDYSTYYKSISDERRKLFKYYYLTLMLNIPSNIKVMDDQTNKQFLNYCIENSITKVKQLQNKPSRTIHLCLIKLYMMRIVVDLDQMQFPDLTTFRPHFESIENTMKVWDSQSQICKIIHMDCHFLRLGVLYRQLRLSNKPETYHEVLEKGRWFKNQYQKASHELMGNLILEAKFQLMMAQCYFLTVDKIKQNHRGFDVFKISYQYSKKQIELKQAVEIFAKNNLKFLEVRAMVKIVRISLSIAKKKGPDAALEDYFKIKFDSIVKIRQILGNPIYKIVLKQSETQLNQMQQKVNNKIQEKTQNFIVFMKASPLLSVGEHNHHPVQRAYNFKSIIQSIFEQSLIDEPKPSKSVSVRFEILTRKAVTTIINQGCSIIFLTVDAVEENEQTYLIFEKQDFPIEDKVEIRTFLKEINFKNVGLVVVCGNKSHIVGSRIRQMPVETPVVITVSYKSEFHETVFENYYDMGYHLYSIKSLERIAFHTFMRALVQKIVFSPLKIKNQDIANLANSTKQYTIIYMMNFSKQTSNAEKLRNTFLVQTHPAKIKVVQFQFHTGRYHNISTQRSTLTNLKILQASFVGRQKILIEIMTDLINSKIESKPYYLNIYGNRRSGKSSFLKQLGDKLIQRGHFKKGIYLLSGMEIAKDCKGNLSQYLEKNKNSIFQITYFNQQNIKNSSQMLIMIDDYHLIKDKSQSLEYFFNAALNKNVNIIISTDEKLSGKQIPEFGKRILSLIELKRFTDQESSLLSYTFIPLFDFREYLKVFKTTFFNLKKEKNAFTPQIIIQQFKKILFSANKDKSVHSYPNYYIYMLKEYQFEMDPGELEMRNNRLEVPTFPHVFLKVKKMSAGKLQRKRSSNKEK